MRRILDVGGLVRMAHHTLYKEKLYGPIFRNLLTITYTILLVQKSTTYTAVSATY